MNVQNFRIIFVIGVVILSFSNVYADQEERGVSEKKERVDRKRDGWRTREREIEREIERQRNQIFACGLIVENISKVRFPPSRPDQENQPLATDRLFG